MTSKDMKNTILGNFKVNFNAQKVFDKYGYFKLKNRGKYYCGCCGNLLENQKAKKCSCGAKLIDNYNHYNNKTPKTFATYYETSMYYITAEAVDDWVMFRYFVLWNTQKINTTATDVVCKEVQRLAINNEGKKIYAKIRTVTCWYNYDWRYDTPLSVKDWTGKYDISTTRCKFDTKKVSWLKYADLTCFDKINKYASWGHHINHLDLLNLYRAEPVLIETLVKLKRFDLVAFYNEYSRSNFVKPVVMLLARKNAHFDTTAQNYYDYISALSELGKDLKNIAVVCPKDFEKADITIQRQLANLKAKKEVENAISVNDEYVKKIEKLLNINFGNGKYNVRIIPSVMDFYLEGKVYFKNCCYAREYYKKANTYIFVITNAETKKRCEMAEINYDTKENNMYINQI